jgi:outer membrane protein TolC
MKRAFLVCATLCFTTAGAWAAEPPVLTLSLDQAVAQAFAHSSRLQAKAFELEAYRSRESTGASVLWPRLSLEASYRYVSEVPAKQIAPNLPALEFGDHNNYSVGPQLAWNFMDSGGAYFNWLAGQAAARAKEDDYLALQREIRLRTRLAYFQTQLALAQVSLVSDQLRVVQTQYRDISNQTRAGQASRIDQLSSHQDVLNNQRQLRQSQTDLSSALRDLLNLTGAGQDVDPVRPAEAGTTPAADAVPTVLLAFDPLEQSLGRLDAAGGGGPDANHPQVKLFLELAEAGRRSADSLGTGHWPKVQAAVKTSWDYPNAVVLETVHQNTLAIAASWSLFEFGRITNQVAEQQHNADMSAQQAEQARQDLQLAWRKAQDLAAQMRDLQSLDRQAVSETDELARLVYQSYRTGRSSYLEVQTANYRALGAKIQAVRTNVLLLMQLATLESLAAPNAQASPEQVSR